MEPEGSLPHSQAPATCPYPEPEQSSPCPPSHFLKIRLNIILPAMPGSSKCYPSLRFPHHNPAYTSSLPPQRINTLCLFSFRLSLFIFGRADTSVTCLYNRSLPVRMYTYSKTAERISTRCHTGYFYERIVTQLILI